MAEKTLIYDIECKSFNVPNPHKDILRLFGCYSYITNKYYFLTKKDEIEKIISAHDYFVGYNNLQYDNVVLCRFLNPGLFSADNYGNVKIKYKTNIDLLQIIKDRAVIIKLKQGMLKDLLMRYSLDYVTKILGLADDENGKILDFDYSIFSKLSWTEEEQKIILEYSQRDIELTKKLYEWLEDYFSGFKFFLDEKDIKNKNYLTCKVAAFAYKAICKALGIKEEYIDIETHASYKGGYVSYPSDEYVSGDIYCLDFNSLYPSIMHQCNIYSPVSDNNGWHGDGFFKVVGYYNDKEQGKIEKLIKRWYEMRLEYKKQHDNREYTIKIILNTMYGLLGNEKFKHLHNSTSAADITSLARQWILLARKMFREAGYKIIYTDTDSVYLLDNFKDKDMLLKVKNEIISTIKSHVPFPYKNFDMGIDDEISDIWFFKARGLSVKDDEIMDEDDYINKNKGLMKKNYLYITKDGEVKYKNLMIKKKSSSLLARKIFNEYLISKIKREKKVKFSKTYFINLILKLLEEDLSLATKRYSVNDFKSYKNETQLQAQIAKRYGAGVHFLIKNSRYGVGKKDKYCTIEEFKENNLRLSDIVLDTYIDELAYFISDKEEINLMNWR